MTKSVDVLIIGGGPAGTTVGSLLRRYSPHLRVLIVEREQFPRDHIGESQLPAICKVLNEIGVWDKVEAAGFPIKIGSTYRWGRTDELWQVNFLTDDLQEQPRPNKFEGQRARTAFQVDRSIYDKILLDHSREVGCEVIENMRVTEVLRDGDRILGVRVAPTKAGPEEAETVTARFYVDASGVSGIIRRSMDVEVDSPTTLRNIALYDYWQDAEWAETICRSGTRAQIMSIGWGWLWYIAITSTRTSIGLVTPASYLKSCGKKPEDLYLEAIAAEPRISKLVGNARREKLFQTTKDWNYISDRLAGENWFLVGDACGFADPILTAGMTLAQVGARKVAYTILELERKELDPGWLRSEYTRTHRSNIIQHIRFAEFWYSSNGCFTDLQENCKQIAQDAGLDLSPDNAFRWLGTGGFASDVLADEEANIFGFQSARVIISRFTGLPMTWSVTQNNRFKLDLVGAVPDTIAYYQGGRVISVKCYKRGEKILPLNGPNQFVFSILNQESDATTIARHFTHFFKSRPRDFPNYGAAYQKAFEVLETMISEGWVTASVNKARPFIPLGDPNTKSAVQASTSEEG
ncbi:MAG: NAD(P)/FAD-dependent oxidoreductase [Fimbriimonas sp.]|nr:NAD(P)/FAD-dependent oxidoreductase [Fimbriimonas sp.]